MKMSSLSRALKLLLLLTSLCHHYSGLVTGADPAKDICASIATNNPVNFFLVGRRSSNLLLITAQPDYLVYELPFEALQTYPQLLQNDTLNMSSVKPIPLENYFPVLYQNEMFQKLIYGKNESQVKIFTTGSTIDSSLNTYLRMVSIGSKLLFTYNMDTNETNVNPSITVPYPVQEFVSASDDELAATECYSFYNDQTKFGSIRMKYDLEIHPDLSNVKYECTCETTDGKMVLRDFEKNCYSYGVWRWTESYKCWADNFIELNNTIRFYLFDKTNQQVMMFDQNDSGIAYGEDIISVVRYKKYKDFFVCPASIVTTLIPSSTSAQPNITSISSTTSIQPSTTSISSTTTVQPNTTSNVTEVSNRTTVTSATPVHNATSSATTGHTSMQTSSELFGSTEKPKYLIWIVIVILIVVITLVVIIIIVIGLIWCYYDGKKSSGTKPDKVVFKAMMSNVKSNVSGGSAASIHSSMVAPSQGPDSKAKN